MAKITIDTDKYTDAYLYEVVFNEVCNYLDNRYPILILNKKKYEFSEILIEINDGCYLDQLTSAILANVKKELK